MFEYPNRNASSSSSSSLDAIALYGYNSISCLLSRLFTSVGLRVYLVLANSNDSISSTPDFLLIKNPQDLPYLSSVLINCQNDLILIKNLINSFPKEYKQRMAYVECSLFLREDQIERFFQEIHLSYYLCMNLIELDSSTMIQPHLHLICSGDEIVYQKLLVHTNLPAKITFLNQTKTPYESFFLCLFYRYSQALHLLIYAEMFAILKSGNSIYPGHLQFLFDWSSLKRPLIRQMILQSSSSSFTFTTINDFQLLLECINDYFFRKHSNATHLRCLTLKLENFLSNFNFEQKQKPVYELFTLY